MAAAVEAALAAARRGAGAVGRQRQRGGQTRGLVVDVQDVVAEVALPQRLEHGRLDGGGGGGGM